ncbi:hypothetical protein NHX12_008912 [Muraenolepis orangiensis]|uniref:Uncharacterized protein n=1 Tax=Muraenolepis orangiensis TaxID=630683 RepID=A0A9Q0I9T8_9TELE|nr:hypothetical protein NHX12_008912 [Muraenolepis orangiensis]
MKGINNSIGMDPHVSISNHPNISNQVSISNHGSIGNYVSISTIPASILCPPDGGDAARGDRRSLSVSQDSGDLRFFPLWAPDKDMMERCRKKASPSTRMDEGGQTRAWVEGEQEATISSRTFI